LLLLLLTAAASSLSAPPAAWRNRALRSSSRSWRSSADRLGVLSKLLLRPSSVVSASRQDVDDENGVLFFPAPRVGLVVVVNDAVEIGADDAAVGCVAAGDDCFSEPPSEMDTALEPPHPPHMNPRAILLMPSRPPPRRRDIIAFIGEKLPD
jgi:hypothetical protein